MVKSWVGFKDGLLAAHTLSHAKDREVPPQGLKLALSRVREPQ